MTDKTSQKTGAWAMLTCSQVWCVGGVLDHTARQAVMFAIAILWLGISVYFMGREDRHAETR